MLNKQSFVGHVMVWPFRKTQEDFSQNWLSENRILPEYRSVFNMKRSALKKGLKRHRNEIIENITNIKDYDIQLSQIEIDRDRLNKAKNRLEQREDADTNTELRRVDNDLQTSLTKIETIGTNRLRTTMRNVDLDRTCELLDFIVKGTYKSINDAKKHHSEYEPIMEDYVETNLAPLDSVNNARNFQHKKENQDESNAISDDNEPFDPAV
jgi:hypothetical protein